MKLRDLWRGICPAIQPFYIMKNESADTSGVNAAATESAKLGRDAFDWFKQEYANTAGDRQATQDRANAVSDAQLASMNYALDQAKDTEAYNKNTFRPLEQRLVTEAQNYDTTDRRNSEATAAVADVNRQVAAQRLATQQNLARAGVSPESGRSQALSAAQDIEAAKASAGAAFTARKNVEQQGYARMADAANLGRNLPSQQATQQSLAGQSGTGAVQSSQAGLQAGMSGAGLMQTGFNTGIAGAQTAGNLFGQQAQLTSGGGADMGGLGSLMGGAAALYKSGMFSSSKELKQDKRAVSMSDAVADDELAGTKRLKVEAYRYKPGEGDGGEHIGGYAEDVQQQFGDGVAPGGKVISIEPMRQVLDKAEGQLVEQFQRVQKKLQLLREQRGE